MRIAVIGQSAFGQKVLEAIVKGGKDEVVGVFCPPDAEGRDPDPIKTAAQGLGVDVLQFKRMRNQDAIDAFKSLKSELCVMAYVTDIVPMDMINYPSKGTVQYHPSLLPRHRGPSSINWPIIWGERETGLTIFWPDDGLDTGPVLLQKRVEIGPDDTLGSLYFNSLFPMGVDAIVESVELVREGTAPKVAQDESAATYEGWCKAEQGEIDWSKPAQEVYNLIRGCNPQPGAWTTRGGEKVAIFESALIRAGMGGEPGAVIAVSESGFIVAAGDGAIGVQRVRPPKSGKVSAAEYATAAELKAGEKLG